MPSCPCLPEPQDSTYDLIRKTLTAVCNNGGRIVPTTVPSTACCFNSQDSKYDLWRKILTGVCSA